MRFLLFFFLFLAGCAHGPAIHAPVATHPSLQDVAVFYDYALRSSGAADDDGFLATDRCDSLLWSGLWGATHPGTVHLTSAREPGGRWRRRPATYEPCESPLSKDMLLGVLYWAWAERRLDVLEDLWDYLQTHGSFADQASIQSFVGPQFAGLIARTLRSLGGCQTLACQLASLTPNLYPRGLLGFEAHLQALEAVLDGLTSGYVDPEGASRVSEAWVRSPTNPFLAAAVHRLTGSPEAAALAISGLLDSSRWPSDRLPNADVLCDDWPTQREPGDDWAPCAVNGHEERDYRSAAGSWLFAYWLLVAAGVSPNPATQ